MRRAVIVTVGVVLADASTSATDQWPSYRGPNPGVAADGAACQTPGVRRRTSSGRRTSPAYLGVLQSSGTTTSS
jgi:hypothetical protein